MKFFITFLATNALLAPLVDLTLLECLEYYYNITLKNYLLC